MRHSIRVLALICAFGPSAALATDSGTDGASDSATGTTTGQVRIDPVLTGLNEPWGVDFLPDGAFLVTELAGQLLLVRDGVAKPVAGIPQVWVEGQGGLLDVMAPRDFAQSRKVWLTFATAADGGADGGANGGGATAVGSGQLSADGTRLDGFVTHWQGVGMPGGRHFGSRLVEAPDGTVFVTTGDRGTGPDGMQAQDAQRPEGKVIHLSPDGSPATSLPGHAPGVFSIGHRNAQGATLDAQGNLWLVEHGARGGDELNRIEAGRNYGWPVISYGENYNGDSIGEGVEKPGMEQPFHYWVPSIAPSGLMIYQGDLFADWRGDVFTGSLNSDFISRLDPENGYAEDRIATAETARVRDVMQAPDGSIWFLSVINGALYRMTPAP